MLLAASSETRPRDCTRDWSGDDDNFGPLGDSLYFRVYLRTRERWACFLKFDSVLGCGGRIALAKRLRAPAIDASGDTFSFFGSPPKLFTAGSRDRRPSGISRGGQAGSTRSRLPARSRDVVKNKQVSDLFMGVSSCPENSAASAPFQEQHCHRGSERRGAAIVWRTLPRLALLYI